MSKIKERIEEKEGVAPAQQRLVLGGEQMHISPPGFLCTQQYSMASQPFEHSIFCRGYVIELWCCEAGERSHHRWGASAVGEIIIYAR